LHPATRIPSRRQLVPRYQNFRLTSTESKQHEVIATWKSALEGNELPSWIDAVCPILKHIRQPGRDPSAPNTTKGARLLGLRPLDRLPRFPGGDNRPCRQFARRRLGEVCARHFSHSTDPEGRLNGLAAFNGVERLFEMRRDFA